MQDAVLSQDASVYRRITDKIIEAIEAGAGPFKMPWHTSDTPMTMPENVMTGAPYKGVNILSLWAAAMLKGFPSGHWASYRQWQKSGAQVRGGERGTPIIFYKRLDDGDDQSDDIARFVARSSSVFNAAQVDGWISPPPPSVSKFDTDEVVEAFVAATNARIRHGFTMAKYRRDLDDIEMPSPAWFTGTASSSPKQSYYAALLHELTHWTGASHRLNRTFGSRFGDHAYAMEELVAELGAAFLCAALGIANEPRPDHAAYLSSWLEVLGKDSKALFMGTHRAQEAAEYLSGLALSSLDAI